MGVPARKPANHQKTISGMPSRPFLIKDIATQADVSEATVDRVLNARAGVRPHMVRRVRQALQELERQRDQVGGVGRKYVIDVVMETPERFSTATRVALEAEMTTLRPALFRARYQVAESFPIPALVRALDRIASRGSHGVLLKAPDDADVTAAIDRLVRRGIPVITLVTDVPASRRLAYVGMDNLAAGATAAYLIGQWLPREPAAVLVSLSSRRFQGEELRENGFRTLLARDHRHLRIETTAEGLGVHDATLERVTDCLRRGPDIVAVYSTGGANPAILEAFARRGRPCRAFIGHDLDQDNRRLLRERRLSAVLHHDLRYDLRGACQRLIAAHDRRGAPEAAGLSAVQIVTPFNLPSLPSD